jgi:type I protein arginine methyltransferase
VSAQVLDEHLAYWADQVKIDRYRAALRQVVTERSVVLDLGTGSGLLTLLACEAGARRVYAIESESIAAVAQEIFEQNGVADRVVLLRGLSTSLSLPERADVLVGDQMGGMAYTAGVFPYYADAAARLLEPNGVTVPAEFELLLAGVDHADVRAMLAFLGGSPSGYDLSPALELARNQVRTVDLASEHLLTEPTVVHARRATDPTRLEVSSTLTVRRDGDLVGLAGMFIADMAPGVTMSNVPGRDDKMLRRRQDLFPVDRPIAVSAGDRLRIELMVNPSTHLAVWRVGHLDRAGRELSVERHSTFAGAILDPEQVGRLAGHDFAVGPVMRALSEAVIASASEPLNPRILVERVSRIVPDVPLADIERVVRGFSVLAASSATGGRA